LTVFQTVIERMFGGVYLVGTISGNYFPCGI